MQNCIMIMGGKVIALQSYALTREKKKKKKEKRKKKKERKRKKEEKILKYPNQFSCPEIKKWKNEKKEKEKERKNGWWIKNSKKILIWAVRLFHIKNR